MTAPPPVLRTERLELRAAGPGDAADPVRFRDARRDRLAPWGPTPGADRLDEGARRRCPLGFERERRRGAALRRLLRAPGGSGIPGTANPTRITRGAFPACNPGDARAREAEGRGPTTEALRAVVAHAFGPMDLHRIEANHVPENTRSAALLARPGFVREGCARDDLGIGGRWRDHVRNAPTRPDHG